jgi:hypothetical protein
VQRFGGRCGHGPWAERAQAAAGRRSYALWRADAAEEVGAPVSGSATNSNRPTSQAKPGRRMGSNELAWAAASGWRAMLSVLSPIPRRARRS